MFKKLRKKSRKFIRLLQQSGVIYEYTGIMLFKSKVWSCSNCNAKHAVIEEGFEYCPHCGRMIITWRGHTILGKAIIREKSGEKIEVN